MNVLYLVTARGGSKGIPGKNLAVVGGLPLVAYKIISARRCRVKGRILCSTDSPEIAEVARRYGAEIPFLRPAELATDDAPSVDVVLHAMDWVEAQGSDRFDAVMLLEPSSPFATHEDFDRAAQMFEGRIVDSVIGVREVEVSSVYVSQLGEGGRMDLHFAKMKAAKGLRRQDRRPEYTMNGALYLIQWSFLRANRSVYGENSYAYVMPREYSLEIDAPEDLRYARYLIDQGGVDRSYWDLDAGPRLA